MDDKAGTAATRAKNKYNSKNYDSLRIIVKKGRKKIIQSAALAVGQSINGYVNEAVENRMLADGITLDDNTAEGMPLEGAQDEEAKDIP